MAGDSAREKYESLRDARRDRLRSAKPTLLSLVIILGIVGAVFGESLFNAWWLGAGVALLPTMMLFAPSQQEIAWRKGADGEATVGRALDSLEPEAWALHDRLIPGSRANIDHILIGPSGVWTVDAKHYSGRLETRARATQLWINGRNRSKLLDQADRQRSVVQEVLRTAGLGRVPVHAALCFVGVEWPLLFRPSQARGVTLTSPRRLRSLATVETSVPLAVRRQVTYELERRLAPATGRPSTPMPPRAAPTHRSNKVPPPPPPTRERPVPADLVVTPWKRYGKDRLYVNRRNGTTVGYVDLETNAVSATTEADRLVVCDAVAAYLRRT